MILEKSDDTLVPVTYIVKCNIVKYSTKSCGYGHHGAPVSIPPTLQVTPTSRFMRSLGST